MSSQNYDISLDLWLAVGRHDAAERLSHLAADIRHGEVLQ